MNKDEETNKENNENSDIVNSLYSDNSITEKHNYIENSISPEVENDGDNKKYTKEMYALADKNEFNSNVFFYGSGAVIVLVIIVSILLNSTFMKPKTDVTANKIVTKTTVNSSSIKVDPIKPVETTNNKIYEYLNIETNRTSVLKKAIALNKGSQKGVTIYLLSEILRLNSIDIPANTYNVKQLMDRLTSMNWVKNSDFNQLEKGDICFTTDVPKKPGTPTQAYVFMGWVEAGKTDYAYVCDGQIEEYGDMLHKRNISIATPQKEKFNFFLRK